MVNDDRDDGLDHGGDPLDDLEAAPAAAEVLALAATAVPSGSLRPRVLGAALESRPAGRPSGGVAGEAIDELEALARTMDDVEALVGRLVPDEGERPTVEGWTVAGLLGHLLGVQDYLGSVFGWWPTAVADDSDHLAMTHHEVEAGQWDGLEATRARWRLQLGEMRDRLASLAGRLDETVRFHGFELSTRAVLVAATFELWTHGEDVARATGRSVVELDAARLRVMTDAAVRALPLGMALIGAEGGHRAVRVVLTGDGGGHWLQPLDLADRPAGDEVVGATLVAGAVDFCRVAAKRLSPASLDVAVTGDADLVADVLRAAAVFAA